MHILVYRNTIFYVRFTDYYGLMTENNREERRSREGSYVRGKKRPNVKSIPIYFRRGLLNFKTPTHNGELPVPKIDPRPRQN